MEEKYREVKIILDNDEIVTEFDQGDMSEDEFIEAIIEYVMTNIQVEVIWVEHEQSGATTIGRKPFAKEKLHMKFTILYQMICGIGIIIFINTVKIRFIVAVLYVLLKLRTKEEDDKYARIIVRLLIRQ